MFAMTEDRQKLFSERYASSDMPWDSGITPPEIMELLAGLPAGNALDLGCGTGTVIRDLLQHGWRADGSTLCSGRSTPREQSSANSRRNRIGSSATM